MNCTDECNRIKSSIVILTTLILQMFKWKIHIFSGFSGEMVNWLFFVLIVKLIIQFVLASKSVHKNYTIIKKEFERTTFLSQRHKVVLW